MNTQQINADYERRMRKALMKGDFPLFDNIKAQYERFMQKREQVPAKTITDLMTPEDRELCNHLLRKIPILADIAEGEAVRLLGILQKYDKSVALPMQVQLQQLAHIAKTLRSIIDKPGDQEFAISFGDTSDKINEIIDDIFTQDEK